jgi:hypothetical protein
MAIATSTALAIGGLAVSAGTAGMSFAQAKKQRNLQQQAKEDAQKAMEDARRALEVNYYDKLAIQKEPYELQREALLSQGAQAIQAGVEGESRGAAATAGRVAMAQNEAQAGIRTAMGKEMGDLAKLSAQEDARLRDVGVQLDLAEVEGAQQAAADAGQAAAAATAQGMQSVGSAIQQGIQLAPLYGQNLNAQRSALSKMEFTPEEFAQFGNVEGRKGGGSISMGQSGTNGSTNMDFQKIAGMNDLQFIQFKRDLTPEQSNMLFMSDKYLNNYNANPFQIY